MITHTPTFKGLLFILEKDGDSAIALTWISLEDIILNKISWSQKDRYCMILLL